MAHAIWSLLCVSNSVIVVIIVIVVISVIIRVDIVSISIIDI